MLSCFLLVLFSSRTEEVVLLVWHALLMNRGDHPVCEEALTFDVLTPIQQDPEASCDNLQRSVGWLRNLYQKVAKW